MAKTKELTKAELKNSNKTLQNEVVGLREQVADLTRAKIAQTERADKLLVKVESQRALLDWFEGQLFVFKRIVERLQQGKEK